MHPVSSATLVAQTSGFAVGVAISALLLALVSRFGGSHRLVRFFFGACLLTANGAGLAKNMVLLLEPADFAGMELLRAVGYAAAAMLPLCIVMLWRDNPVSAPRRRAGKLLLYYSAASGASIAGVLIFSAIRHVLAHQAFASRVLDRQDAIGNLTFYNGLVTVILACMILSPAKSQGAATRAGLGLVILGLLFSSLSALLASRVPPGIAAAVRVARFQSSILVAIGMLLLFSRFRAADIFAKYAIRVVLGALLSLGAALAITTMALSTRSFEIVACAAIIACAIVLFFVVAKRIEIVVERRVLGRRDARIAIQEFRDEITMLDSRDEVLERTRSAGAEMLGMSLEEVTTRERAGLGERLAIAPAHGSQLVLEGQIQYLREIGLHAARRLDELDRERERIESARLESRLNEQLARAELRALRAQVNPHFLFNSLNTIASLTVSQPQKAETITLRLANVFRYVLIHADMPFSSLDEEIGFLRTYLDVERIRFGERLEVEFDIESSIAYAAVPSLILQPLVENAIKHGVAPKVGNCRIAVRTKRREKFIVMTVEDDGVGLGSGNGSSGVGLRNIRERLQLLYGENASLRLTGHPEGGSCATLEIPFEE